ncbi:aminotransferase class I/II-fold pyridoxal phosphate-dependent enzyme [Clostridium sp. JN-1]|uniref:aminotransferase class I/II-fold pyridoxal phosphate-dependent enzyme n=1 Tax=Clostridium sp. JN-1 TaxID=2483110 RepID=UPI000F0B5025|nr:aminotransferase class I/II-fold pyridoxal phosphate-dependent enzyme [Clostridium sp. JN-1]
MATYNFDEAVSSWIKKRHGWKIKSEWIKATAGVVPAITTAVQAFTKEGDGVIIQSPVYYPFKQRCIYYNNRKAVENPLIFNGSSYEMDFDDLGKKVSDPNNKLLILSSPHNPVGRVWRREELKKLIDICVRHKVIIFSDEIHSDLILGKNKHTTIGEISNKVLDYLIVAYSPSKTFNLAGLKASVIIIPNEKLRRIFQDQINKNEAA